MARTVGSYGPKTMEAIRKAGLRLIFEHGYEAMSLRQLAAEVGIQAGSLYNHIATKQELLFDLIQDHINELLRQLDRALAGKAGATERLHAFVAFHVSYHMTRKREVFIANSELRSLEPKNYEAIVAQFMDMPTPLDSGEQDRVLARTANDLEELEGFLRSRGYGA